MLKIYSLKVYFAFMMNLILLIKLLGHIYRRKEEQMKHFIRQNHWREEIIYARC
jgi:hypothetical protein